MPETQFEDPQEYLLANQGEVQDCIEHRYTLELKYAVLKGCSLSLYDEVPPEETPGPSYVDDWGDTPTPGIPKDDYILLRKKGLLETDDERLQFVIEVQECANKHRNKTMIISVPV